MTNKLPKVLVSMLFFIVMLSSTALASTDYTIYTTSSKADPNFDSVYFNPSFKCNTATLSYVISGKQTDVKMSPSSLMTQYGWVAYNLPKNSQVRVTYVKTGDPATYTTSWQTIN